MSKQLCKGGCGREATFQGWCRIKWKSGNKFAVGCPVIESKRRMAMSKFRIEEAKIGKNPMQNPLISIRNHSPERNKKASMSLRELGKRGLLPQQIEDYKSKERRKKNVSKSLRKLFEEGNHPRQRETPEKRKERIEKMTNTLIRLGEQGKLPVQNMSEEQKKIFGEKISKKLREGLASGRIKLSKSWKKVPYKGLFLRSNWEREVAKFLDTNQIEWKYESLKIPYLDSEKDIERTTIPDFYIPSINTIIEVKSNAEYNSQKTRDKTSAIQDRGFNFILIGRKEIDLIKNNRFSLISTGAEK